MTLLQCYQRHLCRLPDWPPGLLENLRRTAQSPVYLTMQVFEQSAHMPHLEEPDRYRASIRAFLAHVEERDV